MSIPVIFTSTIAPHAPALLRFPDSEDPRPFISDFPRDFFSWSDRYGCALFDSGRVLDVVHALFKDFSRVAVISGKAENELEYSNEVTRPRNVRARST
ncbi:hypothetical protein ACGFYQ_27415 [Streptomyces sp. NPDC048258]|uniref:hypothetical protein n=1 Tax=Streptomyces sp. NPDC048258 TaxID=3365527 RepID=UPI0037167F8C